MLARDNTSWIAEPNEPSRNSPRASTFLNVIFRNQSASKLSENGHLRRLIPERGRDYYSWGTRLTRE